MEFLIPEAPVRRMPMEFPRRFAASPRISGILRLNGTKTACFVMIIIRLSSDEFVLQFDLGLRI